MFRKYRGKGKEKEVVRSSSSKYVPKKGHNETWEERYARAGWTDADLQAMAVVAEQRHGGDPKYRQVKDMVKPLMYTHQITEMKKEIDYSDDSKPPRKMITVHYDTSKPPRDWINSSDVVFALTQGAFSMLDKSYTNFHKYCVKRSVRESTAGYQQFPDWEYDFLRSFFYLQAGDSRWQLPGGTQFIFKEKHFDLPKVPLDNRFPPIVPKPEDFIEDKVPVTSKRLRSTWIQRY